MYLKIKRVWTSHLNIICIYNNIILKFLKDNSVQTKKGKNRINVNRSNGPLSPILYLPRATVHWFHFINPYISSERGVSPDLEVSSFFSYHNFIHHIHVILFEYNYRY